jgi:hypothetical protein
MGLMGLLGVVAANSLEIHAVSVGLGWFLGKAIGFDLSVATIFV